MSYALSPELKIAASPALTQRGCVNVIQLDEIKSETGLRWEKLKPSIWAHLETLLRQKLGPTDFYLQLDEMSFLVSMPSATAEGSQIFCLRVAHELHTSLLGSCEPEKLQIARATIENDAIHVATIQGEDLQKLTARARLGNAGPEIPSHFHETAGAEKAPETSTFAHHFVPLWDAQKEAITTYRCVSPIDQTAAEEATINTKLKFELSVTISRIRYAAKNLAKQLAAGQKFLTWIPISYDLLGSPVGRMEITATCRGLASDLRPYLILEISDLPYGVPQSRLTELIGVLKPFCRGVAALLPARIANYGAYLGAGLQAIGLSSHVEGIDGPEIGSEMFKLCVAAKKQRIISFVLDVPTMDLLHAARDMGMNLVSSPFVGPAVAAPEPVRILRAQDISRVIPAHVMAA